MINGKKGGATGEWVVMFYRLLLIAFVAFVVLAVSGIFYSYDVNVRESEAIIMTRQVIDCLTLGEEFNSEKLNEINLEGLFNYCNLGGNDKDRYFVRVLIKDFEGNEISKIEEGDFGSLWIKEIYRDSQASKDTITKKYSPGYYSASFEVMYQNKNINLVTEVMVKHE